MAETVTQSEKAKIVSADQEPRNPNPLLSLLPKFPLFNFLQPKQEQDKATSEASSVSEKSTEEVSLEGRENKRVVVKFPDTRSEIPPLKLEAEEAEHDTNPAVLWQVYAIGGFFILRWLWARWNERRAKKGPADDEASPANE